MDDDGGQGSQGDIRCYGPLQGRNVADADRVDAIVGLLAGIAAAEGWQPGDHLARFRDWSEYFGVWQGPGQTAPVGALQLVRANTWSGMPCRLFWPDADVSQIAGGDVRKIGEVLVLALAPSVRGRGDLFWSLGAALFCICRDSGITDLVAEVPPRNLPLYRRLGWPFRIVGDLAIHWGEPCYFCSLNVAEVEATVRAKAELGSSHHAQTVANAYREISQL